MQRKEIKEMTISWNPAHYVMSADPIADAEDFIDLVKGDTTKIADEVRRSRHRALEAGRNSLHVEVAYEREFTRRLLMGTRV